MVLTIDNFIHLQHTIRMYDYFGPEFHTFPVIKHLKVKILSNGGLWSNVCLFICR